VELLSKASLVDAGTGWEVTIGSEVLVGKVVSSHAFARLVAPINDIATLVSKVKLADVPREALLKGSESLRFDPARLLAMLEKKNPKLALIRDEEVKVVSHHEGPLHIHVAETSVPGLHHLGVYVEGVYCPEHSSTESDHDHDKRHGTEHADNEPCVCGPVCSYERFTRLLNTSVPLTKGKKPGAVTKK